jgi:hypothetical protein
LLGDQPDAYGILAEHNDGNAVRGLLGRDGCLGARAEDDIDPLLDQFGGEAWGRSDRLALPRNEIARLLPAT